MAERPLPSDRKPTARTSERDANAATRRIVLESAVLRNELTPRSLFTNLFPLNLPIGSLGPVRAAKCDKEEFDGRKRPRFYQAGDTVYAYGVGVDEFVDRRFNAAIVTSETDRDFTKFLLSRGLMEHFRANGFKLRGNAQGFTVQDHTDIIKSSKKGVLHIIPQFNFQPYWVECTDGSTRFAFSIEPRTTTLPTFHIHEQLRKVADALDDLWLQLSDDGCRPGCPLYGRKGEVIGRFKGFAASGAALDCTCHEASFDAVAIQVVSRQAKPGSPRRRGAGRSRSETIESTLTIPGQLVVPAPAQRRLLKLSNDKVELERAGRVWLGDLAPDRRIRPNALQVRYERMQAFLARIANDQRAAVKFQLPTGLTVQLERIPIAVEEIANSGSRFEDGDSPYA